MAVISNVQYKSEGAIPIQIDHPTFPGAETGIIEEAKTNPKAFGQLYELHYSAILSYIFHRTLNRSIAEDLTSNTFFKALKALAGYKPNAPFRAWLYRIASNEIRNHFRKVKRRRTREESYHLMEWQNELNTVYFPKLEIEAEENKKEQMENYVQLLAFLQRLPDRYQSVITLRYFERLSYQEIADALGKRIGTVKSLLHRGLKRLRKQMDKINT